MVAVDTVTAHRWGPRQWLRVRLYTISFLAYLGYPMMSLLTGHRPVGTVVLGVVGLVGFAACYVRVMWQAVPARHRNRTPYALVAAFVVGAGLAAVIGFDWLTAMAFYGVSMLLVSLAQRRWWLSLGGVALAYLVTGLAVGADAEGVATMAVSVVTIGSLQAAFYRQIDYSIQLGEARAELARLAVTEERLRISRDLHDVLGQRLAAVALKSELAARLLPEHPDRAEAEMIEVGKVAREALDEVRATVSGYRDVSLAGEVRTAAALLGAAGVRATMSGVPVGLPHPVEDVVSWVVREATTNVVRHARRPGAASRSAGTRVPSWSRSVTTGWRRPRTGR
ncbi:sensor histidine kinase [Planosporangium sp. 12N6]|uniref:sensor histidine kinase n=1 Tax=Planosporangium spinosum TaxID=3402278 RepID=UPI003CEE624C